MAAGAKRREGAARAAERAGVGHRDEGRAVGALRHWRAVLRTKTPSIAGRLIWNDRSSVAPKSGGALFLLLEVDLTAAGRAVATVDHSDIRGLRPHGRDPSGAASD